VGICHRWALEFVGSPTLPPKILEFWYPIAGIRRRGQIPTNHIPASLAGIYKFMLEFGNFCQIRLDSGEIGRIPTAERRQIPFYVVSDFFIQARHRKLFYVERNIALEWMTIVYN
jgi:hypothetical protein